jgi:dTDP-glucose 4,6-dehydratase
MAAPVPTAGGSEIPRITALDGCRLFLTGGTGFVGKSLLDLLDEQVRSWQPDLRVRVLSRTPERFLREHPRYARMPWLTFQQGDVVDLQFADGGHTHVLHAAADTHPVGGQSALQWFDQIVEGTRRVLDFALQAHAKRFLLTSSGAIYGPQPLELASLAEDYLGAPPTDLPSSLYGQAKRGAEQLCTLYRGRDGLETVIARCFAFVGEHLELDGPFAIGNFIRDALRGDVIRIRGDGTPVRTYMYGADLAEWLLRLLFEGKAGRAYNVGSDRRLTLLEVATIVRDVLSPGKEIVVESAPVARANRSRYVPNVDRAQRELGLTCRTSLEAAIRLTASRRLPQEAGTSTCPA